MCSLAQERPCCHTRRDAHNTRPRTQCLSSVLAHASSLSESSALLLTRSTTGSACGLNRALLRVCGHTLLHQRPRTRALVRSHMRRRAQHAPSYALSHKRADTCVVAVKVECTLTYAAGHRQRTRPGTRVLACAQTQALPRARPRTLTLSLQHTSRRVQHASLHAMSRERADTYVVALKVERPVTQTATGRARGLK